MKTQSKIIIEDRSPHKHNIICHIEPLPVEQHYFGISNIENESEIKPRIELVNKEVNTETDPEETEILAVIKNENLTAQKLKELINDDKCRKTQCDVSCQTQQPDVASSNFDKYVLQNIRNEILLYSEKNKNIILSQLNEKNNQTQITAELQRNNKNVCESPCSRHTCAKTLKQEVNLALKESLEAGILKKYIDQTLKEPSRKRTKRELEVVPKINDDLRMHTSNKVMKVSAPQKVQQLIVDHSVVQNNNVGLNGNPQLPANHEMDLRTSNCRDGSQIYTTMIYPKNNNMQVNKY